MSEFSPQIRIVVRYLVGLFLGYLAGNGELNPETADPAFVEAVTAVIIGVISEIWYRFAKANGGPT